MASTSNGNNMVDEFEEAFQACLTIITKDDGHTMEKDELKAEQDQATVKFIDLARQMDAFFLQKRFLLSAFKPELIVKEDINDLRMELVRKEELLQKHYDKISVWQNLLADLQGWSKSPAQAGGPGPSNMPQQGVPTPQQPPPPMMPGVMPPQVPGMSPNVQQQQQAQLQQQLQQQMAMQQQQQQLQMQQQQMQQGPPMSPAGHPGNQMMFMPGPPRGPGVFPGSAAGLQAGLQGPLAFLEKTTSNIGMPDARR